MVLVTHDRYLMDRVATMVLGLDGEGHAQVFADYSQWENRERPLPKSIARKEPERPQPSVKKKLSYMEAREFATIEDRIHDCEERLRAKRIELDDPAVASDGARLLELLRDIEEAQEQVDRLIERWAELSEKG
jgi:ATP-binding cassette subfamily F protein uup